MYVSACFSFWYCAGIVVRRLADGQVEHSASFPSQNLQNTKLLPNMRRTDASQLNTQSSIRSCQHIPAIAAHSINKNRRVNRRQSNEYDTPVDNALVVVWSGSVIMTRMCATSHPSLHTRRHIYPTWPIYSVWRQPVRIVHSITHILYTLYVSSSSLCECARCRISMVWYMASESRAQLPYVKHKKELIASVHLLVEQLLRYLKSRDADLM